MESAGHAQTTKDLIRIELDASRLPAKAIRGSTEMELVLHALPARELYKMECNALLKHVIAVQSSCKTVDVNNAQSIPDLKGEMAWVAVE